MKKTTFAAGLCASALSLALLPSMHSMAERNQMITWEKTGKNSVRLKLKLQDQEPADSFTAFSLKLIFESDEPMSEDPAFKFSQNIKSKLDPAVYETRYDEDAQEMTVYVADRDPVLEKGEELDLGTITVDSEENVRISVDRDDFQGVNSFHEKLEVTNFGEYEDYEMILETPEPEEPETEDPETPEPEAPDTPDEDTEDDDSDRNSGRGQKSPTAPGSRTAEAGGSQSWTEAIRQTAGSSAPGTERKAGTISTQKAIWRQAGLQIRTAIPISFMTRTTPRSEQCIRDGAGLETTAITSPRIRQRDSLQAPW